jgi:hypothetical protein
MEKRINNLIFLKGFIKFLSIICGTFMLISLFFPWEKNTFLIRIYTGLGFTTYGFDNLTNLDFLPFVLSILIMITNLIPGRLKFFSILAFISSAYAMSISLFNIYHIISWNSNIEVGKSLWVFMTVASISFVLSIGVYIIINYLNSKTKLSKEPIEKIQ